MMPAESCFVELDVKKPRPDVLRDDSYFQYQLRREREWVSFTSLPCRGLYSFFLPVSQALAVSTQFRLVVHHAEMAHNSMMRLFALLAITLLSAIHVSAQTAASSASATTAPRTSTTVGSNSTSTRSRTSAATAGAPPDVYLNVPELHVGRIELTVEDLSADISLNAKVANLVQLNAGVQVGIKKVNITISEVDAQLELVVRLGESFHNREPEACFERKY
jgi:hypothetical protein